MVVKEFRELRRDRRTLGMLIGLPIILLVVFGYAANFGVDHVTTVVTGDRAEVVAGQLPSFFDVTEIDVAGTADDARDDLVGNRADVAVVTVGDATPTMLVDGSSLFTAQAAVAASRGLGDAVAVDVLFNPDLKTSWVMVPGLIGLILAFIGTIVTSLGLVRERQDGTLEQLAVMPFRPSDVIAGKVAPYFLLAIVDMMVVTLLAAFLFEVPFVGSLPLFASGAAVFLLVVLGFGVMISTISENQGQAIQTALFVVIPQILLSGMIFPLSSMPWGVRWIGYGLPLTYFIDISQGILLRGAGLGSLWVSFTVLVAMAVLVFGGAVLRFRRDLAPRLRSRPTDDRVPDSAAA
jgi:ABC-type multidrug transport system permease subunit